MTLSTSLDFAPLQDHLAMAESCRSAVLGFLAGVDHGWTKRELAEWLVEAYEPLTVRAETSPGRPSALSPVDDERVAQLMCDTREQVVDLMLALATPGRVEELGVSAILRGWVVVIPLGDHVAWAPARRSAMRLSDRVSSLVAVDYLLRPSDYESQLVVCRRCDAVQFDSFGRGRSWCVGCHRKSGFPGALESGTRRRAIGSAG